jgi:multiple sugar transport system ATP-binding protein
VAQNLGFGLKVAKVAPGEIARRIGEVARTLGIESVLERRPKELSGGQRQRVALGRAMVRDPAIFLFDEPLSNLDAQLRVQMRAELKQLHERLRATVVYVTHDQTEAMTLSTRLVVMNKGTVHQIGTPLEVYERPADRFVAQFIGSPTLNLVNCSLQEEDALFLQTEGLRLRVPLAYQSQLRESGRRHVLIGFRPEHVALLPSGGECQPENEADGMVLIAEPLGPHTQVTVMLGMNRILILTPSGRVYRPNEHVRVRFDMNCCHVFADDEAGRSLLRKT